MIGTTNKFNSYFLVLIVLYLYTLKEVNICLKLIKMYCDKVIELLKELERSREDTIPPYNVFNT